MCKQLIKIKTHAVVATARINTGTPSDTILLLLIQLACHNWQFNL